MRLANSSCKAKDIDNQNNDEDCVTQYTVVTYARVSSSKQAKDLETQSNYVKIFAINQGWSVLKEYSSF